MIKTRCPATVSEQLRHKLPYALDDQGEGGTGGCHCEGRVSRGGAVPFPLTEGCCNSRQTRAHIPSNELALVIFVPKRDQKDRQQPCSIRSDQWHVDIGTHCLGPRNF